MNECMRCWAALLPHVMEANLRALQQRAPGADSLRRLRDLDPDGIGLPRAARSSLTEIQALMGDGDYGISPAVLAAMAADIKDVVDLKVQVGLVKGKKQYDRRREIADRQSRRDVEREVADALRGR